jgi:hypothetical protein
MFVSFELLSTVISIGTYNASRMLGNLQYFCRTHDNARNFSMLEQLVLNLDRKVRQSGLTPFIWCREYSDRTEMARH